MDHEIDTCHDEACPEYRELSRRGFLGRGGVAAAMAVAASFPAWLPRVALANDADTARDVLVNIFLRGGCDGLSMVVPAGDKDYYASRPTLGVKSTDLKPLDTFFGLSRPLWALMDAYAAGHLLFVHATGSPDPTRSHFDAMKFMEYGTPLQPASTIFTGWIARHLMTTPPAGRGFLRGLAIATTTLPKSLAGGPATLPVQDLAQFDLPGRTSTANERRQLLVESYEGYAQPLGAAALNTFETIDLLKRIDVQNYQPANNAVYPETTFGRAIKSAAALIKADAGVEVIEVDRGGWDTHSDQGILQGRMQVNMEDVAGAVGALYKDLLTTHLGRVVVIVQSEFGRRVEENGSLGTDHGHGNCMFFLGGAIKGGRVLSKWPGLAIPQRYQGLDLEVTTDYRDLFAEIVQNRLGNSRLDVVFPNHTPNLQGITI
jgi:uncharacterized protein (DUF1501 family)